MERKQKVTVYVNKAELLVLKERAKAVGMSVTNYLRVLGLKVGFYDV